jgi:hypothetical protein
MGIKVRHSPDVGIIGEGAYTYGKQKTAKEEARIADERNYQLARDEQNQIQARENLLLQNELNNQAKDADFQRALELKKIEKDDVEFQYTQKQKMKIEQINNSIDDIDSNPNLSPDEKIYAKKQLEFEKYNIKPQTMPKEKTEIDNFIKEIEEDTTLDSSTKNNMLLSAKAQRAGLNMPSFKSGKDGESNTLDFENMGEKELKLTLEAIKSLDKDLQFQMIKEAGGLPNLINNIGKALAGNKINKAISKTDRQDIFEAVPSLNNATPDTANKVAELLDSQSTSPTPEKAKAIILLSNRYKGLREYCIMKGIIKLNE